MCLGSGHPPRLAQLGIWDQITLRGYFWWILLHSPVPPFFVHRSYSPSYLAVRWRVCAGDLVSIFVAFTFCFFHFMRFAPWPWSSFACMHWLVCASYMWPPRNLGGACLNPHQFVASNTTSCVTALDRFRQRLTGFHNHFFFLRRFINVSIFSLLEMKWTNFYHFCNSFFLILF